MSDRAALSQYAKLVHFTVLGQCDGDGFVHSRIEWLNGHAVSLKRDDLALNGRILAIKQQPVGSELGPVGPGRDSAAWCNVWEIREAVKVPCNNSLWSCGLVLAVRVRLDGRHMERARANYRSPLGRCWGD